MSRYLALFKCELCGEVFVLTEMDDRERAQRAAFFASKGEQSEPNAPMLCDIHICYNGGIGLAKFLGFKQKEGT